MPEKNLLTSELRENFAAGVPGFREIRNVAGGFAAWTVIEGSTYGVAIPNPSGMVINESFSTVRISDRSCTFAGRTRNMLMLFCESRSLRYQFATIATEFVESGTNGSNRKFIQDDPFAWWKKWRELLGNRMTEKKSYAVLGEMVALYEIRRNDTGVVWGGPEASSHDLDTDTRSIEIKSTLSKYKTEITISSQNQLESDKPLFLDFVRMEIGYNDGESIDSMAEKLIAQGYDSSLLEGQLDSLGFGIGTEGRKHTFRILEKRQYCIDENFPRITAASFPDGKMPPNITHIVYTVDLEGLPYRNW